MAEIDPLKQTSDFSISKGSNFKFPPSQKTGSKTSSVSPFVQEDLTGTLNEGYTEYDTYDDVPVEPGDTGAGEASGGGGTGGTPGIIKLPSNFDVTFSSEIVTDQAGNQSASLFVTCSAVPGATDFEVRLVKIS